MKNTLKISVGIPAYNEAKTIGSLVESILKQKLSQNTSLQEILVYSDGSTDGTVSVLDRIIDKRVKVFIGEKRLGKNVRLNSIFRRFTGDILVLLDADIKLDNNSVIQHVVEPFKRVANLGLVAGNAQPIRAKTFVEGAVNNFIYALNDVRSKINNGRNVYAVRGPILALSHAFAKQLHLPARVPDDRYTYFACVKKGFRFAYAEKALVWFRSPSAIKDQLTQGSRFRTDKDMLFLHFDKKMLEKEYAISPFLQLRMGALQIVHNPVGYAFMKYMHFRIAHTFKKPHASWKIALSTKHVL